MRSEKNSSRLFPNAVWVTSVLIAVPLTLSSAQDLVLNPGEISGTVRIGFERLEQVDMEASPVEVSSLGLLASRSYTCASIFCTSFAYSLTVDVPLHDPRTYQVAPRAIYMDSRHDVIHLPLGFFVNVSYDQPASADFIFEPGYLMGRFIVEGSEALASAQVAGQFPGSTAPFGCSPFTSGGCFSTWTDSQRGFAYRIAIPFSTPSDLNIRLKPLVVFANGTLLVLDSSSITVRPGETIVRDFVVPAHEGNVAGTVQMPGNEIPQQHQINVNSDLYLFSPIAAFGRALVDQDGPYRVEELPDGEYLAQVETRFSRSGWLNIFTHPSSSMTPSSTITIDSGVEQSLDISTPQAYLEGRVLVSGSIAPEEYSPSFFRAVGVTHDAHAIASRDQAVDETYRLVASEGTWELSVVQGEISRNGTDLEDRFEELLYVAPFPGSGPQPVLAPGETTLHDIDLAMGKVTAQFAVLGGLTMSSPQVRFQCSGSGDGGQISLFFGGDSYGHAQDGVTEAVTSFLAPAGRCTVTPRAVVNGTLTSFGTAQADVVAGATTLIDPGFPHADAGEDILEPCSEPCDAGCEAVVTLDGSGSSDADGDSLSYTWTGPFQEGGGTASGEMVDVTLPVGTHEVTLTASDGITEDTDNVMVTIAVRAVGLEAPLAALVPAGSRPPLPHRPFSQGTTLPLRLSLHCGHQPLGPSHVAAPEIVALMNERGRPADLAEVTGSSGGMEFSFDHVRGEWIYMLQSGNLPHGSAYTITIRMPDGLDYQARFALSPERYARRTRRTRRNR